MNAVELECPKVQGLGTQLDPWHSNELGQVIADFLSGKVVEGLGGENLDGLYEDGFAQCCRVTSCSKLLEVSAGSRGVVGMVSGQVANDDVGVKRRHGVVGRRELLSAQLLQRQSQSSRYLYAAG